MAYTRTQFIALVKDMAIEEMVRTSMIGKPVLASYTIAQACIESSNGNSAINNNYFGVKGDGDAYQTKEFINGEWITITAAFQEYGTMEASFVGHSQFLIENGRYTRYGVFAAGEKRDWRAASQALENATYATDPDYAEMLIDIIEKNQLWKYDEEADEVLKVVEQLQTELKAAQDNIQEIFRVLNNGRVVLAVPEDDQQTAEWAKAGQQFVLENKVSDGQRPESLIKRQEVWTMLKNYHDNVKS